MQQTLALWGFAVLGSVCHARRQSRRIPGASPRHTLKSGNFLKQRRGGRRGAPGDVPPGGAVPRKLGNFESMAFSASLVSASSVNSSYKRQL